MYKLLKTILILTVSIIIISIFRYYNTYCFKDLSSIEKYICKSKFNNENIIIKNSIDIKNKKYFVFYSPSKKWGNGQATKGINGRYRLEYIETGSEDKTILIEEIDCKSYVILLGYNIKNVPIKTIYVTISDKVIPINFDIKNKKYFIEYKTFNNSKNDITWSNYKNKYK